MLAVLLASIALATPLGEHLDQVSRSGTGVAMSCSDGGEAWRALRGLLQAFEDLDLEALQAPIWNDIFVDGLPVALAIEPSSGRFEVAFPTPLDTESLARKLSSTRPGGNEPTFGVDGWTIRTGDDALRVRVDRGWGHVESDALPADAPPAKAPVELLEKLPLEQGCLVVSRVPESEGHTDAGVHWTPGGGEPLRFAVYGNMADIASVIPLAPVAPVAMTSQAPALAVAALGIRLGEVDFRMLFDGAELQRARMVQRLLPVDSGVLVAALASPTPGDFEMAAVVPFMKQADRPIPAATLLRRALRLGRQLEARGERLDRTHARFGRAGSNVYVSARDGVLLLSTSQAALADMERGVGTAWGSEAFQDQAARFPFVLSAWELPGPKGRTLRLTDPLSLALGVHSGFVTGELHFEISPERLATLVRDLRLWAEEEDD